MQVYVSSLSAYNCGYLTGQWLALPASDEEIKRVYEEVNQEARRCTGEDTEEFFFPDYEDDDFNLINEYSNVVFLNEWAEIIEDLSDEEKVKFRYCMEQYHKIEEAYNALHEICYREDIKPEDYVYELLEDGCFGDIPENMLMYIDCEAIARDMLIEGSIAEFEGGLILR